MNEQFIINEPHTCFEPVLDSNQIPYETRYSLTHTTDPYDPETNNVLVETFIAYKFVQLRNLFSCKIFSDQKMP